MKKKKAIRFYTDNINSKKRNDIVKFLDECKEVQNKLYSHYWNNDNFMIIVKSKVKLDFNRNRNLNYREVTPILKSHHFQQVNQQVYANLRSLYTKIIKRIHFKFKDKEIQAIYNYCSGFCFEWDDLKEYLEKQLKKYNKKDIIYYEFLLKVNQYITDEIKFKTLKIDIENKFWEIKSKYKCPQKHECQIHCNTLHTVDIEKLNYFQWIFIIDSNDRIGGTEKKGVYDKIQIPIKYTKYHEKIIGDKKLDNTFILRLNKYGKIEVIATYNIEINIPKSNPQHNIGIDIGLKKLIATSDGEIIEQNKNILHKLSKVVKKQANRNRLQEHLKKKYNNEDYRITNKRYLKQQARLSNFVKCDNRYKIKSFLNNRLDAHIIMEDLELSSSATFHKETNYLLKRMRIHQIKNDIINYSKLLGIKVSTVNPAYTSQMCPICGHIGKENRKTQEKFCCVKCGHTDNADVNASINIMNRYYDKRIKNDMSSWKVKEILIGI